MIETTQYQSPVGKILLAARGEALIGLWIAGQSCLLDGTSEEMRKNDNCPVLCRTRDWLDRYFRKEKPEISELRLAPEGSAFASRVWQILCEIPYGETTTYGAIAARIARERGMKRLSAQAVGGAVGHNPISIIIPCHRVIGKNGSLVGYNGGIDKKIFLLTHEGVM